MTHSLEGAGGTYHGYDLVYDSVAASADLFVDGIEVISDYSGRPRALNRIFWGSGSTADRCHSHWSKFSFAIGDCGACCTNGPGTESACIVTIQDNCETHHSLYLGNRTECTDDMDCVELIVMFESLSATATADGVFVNWVTTLEMDTVGFRVLRETVGSRETAFDVVAEMVPAAGHGMAGASYEILDNSKQSESARAYYIEDIDIFGKVTRHGPIQVQGRTRERDATVLRIKEGAKR